MAETDPDQVESTDGEEDAAEEAEADDAEE